MCNLNLVCFDINESYHPLGAVLSHLVQARSHGFYLGRLERRKKTDRYFVLNFALYQTGTVNFQACE